MNEKTILLLLFDILLFWQIFEIIRVIVFIIQMKGGKQDNE